MHLRPTNLWEGLQGLGWKGVYIDGHDVSTLGVPGHYMLVFLRSVQTACER